MWLRVCTINGPTAGDAVERSERPKLLDSLGDSLGDCLGNFLGRSRKCLRNFLRDWRLGDRLEAAALVDNLLELCAGGLALALADGAQQIRIARGDASSARLTER